MIHEKVHTPQYVCFDDKSGQIFSIGPSKDMSRFIKGLSEAKRKKIFN